MSSATTIPVIEVDELLLEQVQSQLDLREPNRDAIHMIALSISEFYEQQREGFFEGVVDSATGMGKTFILAGAIDYFAALGFRNFAVITPGSTILNKTIAQFSEGTSKSLVDAMSCTPVVVHSENFRSAAIGAELNDPEKVKLFVFSVQSMTKPTTKQGRRTHSFQEGLGRAFYDHLDELDDLIVFADEHHYYHGPKFSEAVRDLTPYALIGLTATPNEKKLAKDGIPVIYRYPLAAAIAERYVKTPVVVGRKDDRRDERTQLLDGGTLLAAKEKAVLAYCEQAAESPVHPVMLVNCRDIEHAQEVVAFLRSDQFFDGRYAEQAAVIEVHSSRSDDALAQLEEIENPESPTRIVVQVGMLKEGWDVKNVYVICSLRASVSEVLTEQTLGRGLRLPFGRYVDQALLNELDVVAHERYEDLLARSRALTEQFIDHRTHVIEQETVDGETTTAVTEETVQAPVVIASSADGGASEDSGGAVAVADMDARKAQAEYAAEEAEHPLKPLRELTAIPIPVTQVEVQPSEFRLQQVTDETPFRELGRQLAVNPDRYLKRTRVGADLLLDQISGQRILSPRTDEAQRVEAAKIAADPKQARAAVVRAVVGSRVVTSRKGEAVQVERLLDAVMEGAGEKSELLLASYADRLARGLATRIAEVKRTLPAGTQTHTTVKTEPFSPKPRFRRKSVSGNRHGPFAKSTGFEGWKKGLFEQAWFDSKPERAMANILDDAEEIDVWVRLHRDELPILWHEAERTYNPDLLAMDRKGDYWLVETKADKDLPTDEVQEKRKAALTWANAVNAEIKQRWHYLLVAERDLEASKGSWPHIVKATGV